VGIGFVSHLKTGMRFPLIFVFIMALVSPAIGQKLEDITSIAFTKQSRGFLDEVVISRDSVHGAVENHRTPENARHYSAGVENDEWSKLMLALKDVSLDDIDGLQSPTMNRAHDGAIHSTIVITFEDGRSVSHSFDDENPHPDLRLLLDAILEFRIPGGN
ncbi:MAG TPA: hypothetical protein VFO54_00595, partial [Chryseosolibacter sp.]|nr:hypothetical protein [Chryseosolibacter sp.]